MPAESTDDVSRDIGTPGGRMRNAGGVIDDVLIVVNPQGDADDADTLLVLPEPSDLVEMFIDGAPISTLRTEDLLTDEVRSLLETVGAPEWLLSERSANLD